MLSAYCARREDATLRQKRPLRLKLSGACTVCWARLVKFSILASRWCWCRFALSCCAKSSCTALPSGAKFSPKSHQWTTEKYVYMSTYSHLRNCIELLFWAGNQDSYQNFEKIISHMKPKVVFIGKKQNQKNVRFNNFSRKFHELVLWLVGLIDAEGIWCGYEAKIA